MSPLYQYECLHCKHEFELMLKMGASNPECEKCRGETRKLPSAGNFKLKGYTAANGYAKKEGE